MLKSRLSKLAAILALPLLSSIVPLPSHAEVNVESWDGKRALAIIVDLLRFTPRSMETVGHQQAIDYIMAALKKTKFDTIKTQRWIAREAGRSMAMTNIIARFNPSNPRRVIVATHFDSIIKAYRDEKTPEAPMPGANNSASGVAVLLETARVLSLLPKLPIGIDMIFFDGEEGPKSLGAGDPDWKALGSPHFVDHLKDTYPTTKPEKAVVFDMVCAKNIKLKPEPSSLVGAMAEVRKFWSAGIAIAPGAFVPTTTTYPISDDHTALAEAGIPSFLVIDFDYEPWFNTTGDTLDKCDPQSLEAVGRTLTRYLTLP